MTARVRLLVGIDTEGDNQWDASSRARQTFDNIYALGHCTSGSSAAA